MTSYNSSNSSSKSDRAAASRRGIRAAAIHLAAVAALIAGVAIAPLVVSTSASAQDYSASQQQNRYSPNELVNAGHGFFGSASTGLGTLVEKAVQQYGLPNGYILGEEASGALVAGLRYGEGKLFTKNAGDHTVFWQGPSIGWDWGGDGNRTMMLVYNLTDTDKIFRRYVGVTGSAYLVGGLGMTVMKHGDTVLVPVRTGVGARLGVNVGYLKMRPQPTWNPF
ncbi:DUF1134 domain-containing protein [Ahrensia sp. R2A130]|uniref:DUF1134 domain-containing protein n=1 Tax=Ahrensia sp. R2A130 TaxID=744979 RepID=UPI0001E0B52A|nr:DUF1134 domain-containing protein [Ahrensia sp. R2A130]EFL87790.1 conserved hypothetical protein [Ahrensia sp. R2A130]